MRGPTLRRPRTATAVRGAEVVAPTALVVQGGSSALVPLSDRAGVLKVQVTRSRPRPVGAERGQLAAPRMLLPAARLPAVVTTKTVLGLAKTRPLPVRRLEIRPPARRRHAASPGRVRGTQLLGPGLKALVGRPGLQARGPCPGQRLGRVVTVPSRRRMGLRLGLVGPDS